MQRSQIFVQNRVFCLPHLRSTPPLGSFPSEYLHAVWQGKTRMVWLRDGEKISKISLFVLTQLTNVTDTHTDRQTDRHRMWTYAILMHRIALQKVFQQKSRIFITHLLCICRTQAQAACLSVRRMLVLIRDK